MSGADQAGKTPDLTDVPTLQPSPAPPAEDVAAAPPAPEQQPSVPPGAPSSSDRLQMQEAETGQRLHGPCPSSMGLSSDAGARTQLDEAGKPLLLLHLDTQQDGSPSCERQKWGSALRQGQQRGVELQRREEPGEEEGSSLASLHSSEVHCAQRGAGGQPIHSEVEGPGPLCAAAPAPGSQSGNRPLARAMCSQAQRALAAHLILPVWRGLFSPGSPLECPLTAD